MTGKQDDEISSDRTVALVDLQLRPTEQPTIPYAGTGLVFYGAMPPGREPSSFVGPSLVVRGVADLLSQLPNCLEKRLHYRTAEPAKPHVCIDVPPKRPCLDIAFTAIMATCMLRHLLRKILAHRGRNTEQSSPGSVTRMSRKPPYPRTEVNPHRCLLRSPQRSRPLCC